MMKPQEYILRYAAGIYWLIKADQQNTNYIPPLPINECGAMLWDGLVRGYGRTELTDLLQNKYGIDSQEALVDIELFFDQLTDKGIII